jgi:asparagine synthase (glutamine-hydrolysing)
MSIRVGLLKPLSPLGRMLARGHPKSTLTRVGRLLASANQAESVRYRQYVSLFDDATISELSREAAKAASSFAWVWDDQRKGRDPVQTALAVDRITYLPNDLLTKVDRASMLHNLEVRSPFMDPAVVRATSRLTRDQLLTGGKKRMLREAFAQALPASVFTRPKRGFAVPIGEWFRTSLRAMLTDHLCATQSFARQHFDFAVVQRLLEDHQSERVDHSQRLYALLMLELWHRSRLS